MRAVEPKVFLVGETRTIEEGLREYLTYIGVPEWASDAPTDAEELIEVMGRLCYRSFEPGLNPNVTKIREGNNAYLENILEVKHGSVIEHPTFQFVFASVSRVFTHELVRHRAGVAISQESLRFVRLTDIPFWFPEWAREDAELVRRCQDLLLAMEEHQQWMAKHFGLNEEGVKFKEKKHKTSFMRRFAPEGVATSIGWSANPRTLRWVLEMRTDPSAEEEIRLVFGKVGEIVVARYPNLFGDFTVEVLDGLPCYKPAASKV